MERITSPILKGTNLSPVESSEIDQLIARADSVTAQRRAQLSCWCGARVVNGHHCENGHMQHRAVLS